MGFSETLGDKMGNKLCSVTAALCTSESIGKDVAVAGEIGTFCEYMVSVVSEGTETVVAIVCALKI
jgi:hypothetical protein